MIRNFVTEAEIPRVLVVDDMSVIRATVRKILSRAGFEVTEASSGNEALEIASEQAFDLVVMDVDMPGITGFTACTSIKRRVGGEPPSVIMLTAEPAEKGMQEAARVRADFYIEKPFAKRQLLEVVEAALTERSSAS